jgi:hypothetical protein
MKERAVLAIVTAGGNLVKQTAALGYEIWVKEPLDPSWSEWLDDFTILWVADRGTRLAGVVRDQTALYGLLTKIRDLNLTLLSVRRVASENDSSAFPNHEG